MKKVFVLDARRTAIVTAGGKFKFIRPELLAARLLEALRADFFSRFDQTDRSDRSSDQIPIDEIILGNAVGTGGNLARLAALIAELDLPASTVDMQCASGAAAISIGFAKLAAGLADCVIVGGVESASLQPLRVYHRNDPRRAQSNADSIEGGYYTAQFSPDELSPNAMLEGAERVAQAENISKRELDEWAIESHRRASGSRDRLIERIVPIEGWTLDNGIRDRIDHRLLARAPRPLGEGTITSAGNACRINDGAAMIVLASENFLERFNLEPLARIITAVSLGGEPRESPRGAMRTADFLLKKNKLRWEQLSAIEFNEAFAVIDVLFERSHPTLIDRYNRLGGALAYGHPYGASGAILLLHLIESLGERGGLGLLSIAGAGGVGQAILIER